MKSIPKLVVFVMLVAIGWLAGLHFAAGQNTPASKGWKRGTGWGWIWGKDDEVGALNAMTDATRSAARSEERRVGKECHVVCRSRWSPYH